MKKLWARNLENVLLRMNDVERKKKHLKKKTVRDSGRNIYVLGIILRRMEIINKSAKVSFILAKSIM